MGMRFSAGRACSCLPGGSSERGRQVVGLPRKGQRCPDFSGPSTSGLLRFREWAGGSWVLLFCHPAADSVVPPSEAALLGGLVHEFTRRNIRLLGISPSAVEDQTNWHAHLAASYDLDLDFPVIADPTGRLMMMLGLARSDTACTACTSLLIGPTCRIEATFNWPILDHSTVQTTLGTIDAELLVERLRQVLSLRSQ